MDKVREVANIIINKLHEQGLCITEVNHLPAANYLKVSQAVIDYLATDNWQPIETALKDGSSILAYEGFEPCVIQIYFNDGEWLTFHGCERLWKQPTHWQPLPNPPKKIGK